MDDTLLPIDLVIAAAEPATRQEVDAAPAPQTKPLKRISERHHALARALANGMRPVECAATFNLNPGTISALQADPAFTELLNFYRTSETQILRTTQERMAEAANEAIEVVNEILDDPEKRAKMSVGQALEIVKTFADRSGNGPQSTSVQVNIHANLAERLKAARERAAAAMIDITPQAEDAA